MIIVLNLQGIRQYIPKKINFDTFDDDFIKQSQYKINRRPRKNLGFETPKNPFHKKGRIGTKRIFPAKSSFVL